MKTLRIPRENSLTQKSVFAKILFLLDNGAEAPIDRVNWVSDFPKYLPVTVRVAHDGEKLYLFYMIRGEVVRAVNTEDFGPVWEDSCVEFFMRREGESGYRNFECNILGAFLSCYHKTREEGERQTDIMSHVFRQTSICHRYDDSGKEVSDWTLYLEIPKSAMGFGTDESLAGQNIRANFYKCGDRTSEPHFLSWNPIDLPKPNFHVPQFFGLLELQS